MAFGVWRSAVAAWTAGAGPKRVRGSRLGASSQGYVVVFGSALEWDLYDLWDLYGAASELQTANGEP